MIGRSSRIILHASYATGAVYALTCFIRLLRDCGVI